jgi:hypothetical protein
VRLLTPPFAFPCLRAAILVNGTTVAPPCYKWPRPSLEPWHSTTTHSPPRWDHFFGHHKEPRTKALVPQFACAMRSPWPWLTMVGPFSLARDGRAWEVNIACFALTQNAPCSRSWEERSPEGRRAPPPAVVAVPWDAVVVRPFPPVPIPIRAPSYCYHHTIALPRSLQAVEPLRMPTEPPGRRDEQVHRRRERHRVSRGGQGRERKAAAR